MCSSGSPLHLLALVEALGDDCVHHRLGEGGGDHFSVASPFTVVGDVAPVSLDVGLELADALVELLEAGRDLSRVALFEFADEILGVPFSTLYPPHRLIEITVPDVPFDPLQRFQD